jgi:hypothetical protein
VLADFDAVLPEFVAVPAPDHNHVLPVAKLSLSASASFHEQESWGEVVVIIVKEEKGRQLTIHDRSR